MTLLRSSLFNLWFYLGTFAFAAGGLPMRLASRWIGSGWALPYARAWAHFVLFGVRHICGIAWKVRGLENLPPGGAALIVSMHQSAFDTIVWFLLAPRAAYVVKHELTRIPLFGPMLSASGCIAVDRSAGAAAIRALLHESGIAVAAGRQIVIFPEGTRVAPGVRAPLHPGFAAIAARSRLPVIPVTTDSGLLWGRRAFRKRSGVIHIDIHPPFPAGTPRGEMTARLDALYETAARDAARP